MENSVWVGGPWWTSSATASRRAATTRSRTTTHWPLLHNALRDTALQLAQASGISTSKEKGNLDAATEKKPGDLVLYGDHGYGAGSNKTVYIDFVVGSATCASYAAAGAAREGATAEKEAKAKHAKHDKDIGSHIHFVAAPFEADGFTSPVVLLLLTGFARKRADRDNADTCAKNAWYAYYSQALAMTHARSLARCLLNRADDTRVHLGMAGHRRRVSAVDAESVPLQVTPTSDKSAAASKKKSRRDSAAAKPTN